MSYLQPDLNCNCSSFFYCPPRFLGRPHFLFPTDVHLSAVLDILSSFFLKTWPIHLHFLVASMLFLAFCLVALNNCLFENVCGQNILIMFQRHSTWIATQLGYI